MSPIRSSLPQYYKTYVKPNFERSGLFEFIRKNLPIKEVLYSGCGVHITPAFFFPHVVFIDQSEEAIEFFSDHTAIIEEVKRHKTYRRSPYIQFIAHDYTKKLPLRENQFDLLLSLFAGKIAKYCVAYLKPGGFLLTNNHQGDAIDAAKNKELGFLGNIQLHRGKYNFKEKEHFVSKDGKRFQQYLRQTSNGVEYIEEETYYLFQRSSTKTRKKTK